jgi:hypothetical protein
MPLPFPRPQSVVAAVAALLTAGAIGVALPGAGRAELPPWVYGQQQREAPMVVELEVEQVRVLGLQQRLRGRVLRVRRQSSVDPLRPGRRIEIQYSRPPASDPPMPGPSPIPRLKRGQRVTAWLSPVAPAPPGGLSLWAPAAGGLSFGPSLEGAFDP